MKPRVVVHHGTGVSEIVRGEEIEIDNPHEGQWIGYGARREDGWPLCPGCGDDELYSLEMPVATEDTIIGCYACGWKPPTAQRQSVSSEDK